MTTKIAAHVLDPSAMDTSIRPQDDFFRYINGAWLKEHQIPADRASDGTFYTLHDLSEKHGHDIVKDAVSGQIEDPDAHKIATIYSQFMDEETIEAAGAAPLFPLFEKLHSVSSHEELAELAGLLSRTGISAFFSAGVGNDLNDATRYVTHIGQAGLGLPDESYYREDAYAPIRDAYVSHVARMFELSTWASQFADKAPATLAQQVMAFETELASHHWDQVTLRDTAKANNPRTWEEATEEHPGFHWDVWAKAAGYTPTEGKDLNLAQPSALAGGAGLWAATDLDTLKSWFARKVIRSYSFILSDAFVQESFDFYSRTLAGTEEVRPRWKRAMSLIEDLLGESLGRLWVERHFPPTHKEAMDDLVARLLAAYGESIRALEWMSEETKQKALEKLSTFVPKIGYPLRWKDYSALEISDQASLVDNVRAAAEWETLREWAKLGTPVDRDEWFMTPQTVNAYYNPTMNEIVFPAAILQPPFFNIEADAAVNFGAIGAVIGHEIGHGFDDQGSTFDDEGNLNNWWTDEDRERFEERTGALIEQYDGLVPVALRGLDDEAAQRGVNGALTIGENIGDLGGLSIAWKAWVAYLKEQGIDDPADAPIIDGVTGPQRFFMSWARSWRSKVRNELAIQLLAVDPHSPAEFRANQVLANLDAFADTFDVHEGDGMYLAPEKRVSIW